MFSNRIFIKVALFKIAISFLLTLVRKQQKQSTFFLIKV